MGNIYYSIHDNNSISFLTFDAAEKYLLQNYQEYYADKYEAYELSERMIYEERKQ